ncbi:hypothetical protein DRN77_08500 [Methanosarcinales archaeon]|nr:MAG: hypothetical protein DRN77_08500 [Methanosarcinales archaeon]
MNKKQWYALGIMFLAFTLISSYPVFHYEILAEEFPVSDDAYYIVLNVIHQTYVILMWLNFMAMTACWICGWLETEYARQ